MPAFNSHEYEDQKPQGAAGMSLPERVINFSPEIFFMPVSSPEVFSSWDLEKLVKDTPTAVQPFEIYKINYPLIFQQGLLITFEMKNFASREYQQDGLKKNMEMQSFVIPNVEMLYAFFRIVERANISTHFGYRTLATEKDIAISKIAHYLGVCEKVYGKSPTLVKIATGESVTERYYNSDYYYQTSGNYAEHLLNIARQLGINESIVNSFENLKMKDLACEFFKPMVTRVKRMLLSRICNQFNEGFNNYSSVISDADRIPFKKLSINKQTVFDASSPSRLFVDISNSVMKASWNVSDPLFFSALLMLNMNQSSLGDLSAPFQGLLSATEMLNHLKKLAFESSLDVTTSPSQMSILIHTEVFDIHTNQSNGAETKGGLRGSFEISFSYMINFTGKMIHIENSNVVISPELEFLMNKFSLDQLEGLASSEKNLQSTPVHWRRIEALFDLIKIRYGSLTKENFEKLEEEERIEALLSKRRGEPLPSLPSQPASAPPRRQGPPVAPRPPKTTGMSSPTTSH